MALRKFLHRFELRLAVMAAVALLLAQLGAMSHAYSHDAALGSPTTHQAGANSHDPCDDCLAYAPLLAPGGMPGALPFIEPQGRGLATSAAAHSLVDLSLTLAFRSRAPPLTP
jgi:hypothetical protein